MTEEQNRKFAAFLVVFEHQCQQIGVQPPVLTKKARSGLFRLLSQKGHSVKTLDEAMRILHRIGEG